MSCGAGGVVRMWPEWGRPFPGGRVGGGGQGIAASPVPRPAWGRVWV